MKLLTKNQCKLNTKVKLVTGYTPSRVNPVKGSEYECNGVIIDLYKSFSPSYPDIVVGWDNGTKNCYQKHQLVLVDTVKYNSIW